MQNIPLFSLLLRQLFNSVKAERERKLDPKGSSRGQDELPEE